MEKEVFEKLLEGKSEDEKKILSSLYEESQKNYSLKSEAFRERDDIKRKLSEIEANLQKQAEDSAKEQGKYKELYEQITKQLTEKDEQIKTLMPYKDKYSEVETERKKELIERLPEGKLREAAEKITDISLLREHVEAVLETIGDNKGGSFSGRSGKVKIVTEGKKWGDFTSDQLQNIKKDNPAEYNRIYRDKFGRLPKE